MKKLVALTAVCYLLFMFLSITVTGAEAQSTEVFTQAQFKSAQGSSDPRARQIVMLGDTLYAYLDDASVYSWHISESTPRLFCQLPELPQSTSTAYCNLQSDAKAQWDQSVSFLVTGENALWGVNVFTGMIGKMSAEGIQWRDVPLDATQFMPDGHPWPLRVVNAFVSSSTLYVYIAMDNGEYPQNNYQMLAFDMTSGTCSVLDIKNAQGICVYKPGTILLLYPRGESIWSVDEMDLSTGTISASVFQTFSSAGDKPIGGLAYHPVSEHLLFTFQSQVWGATEGEAYAPMAFVPVPDIEGETIAFALKDGRYALFSGCLYVRNLEALSTVPDTLRIEGCVDQTIYDSFSRENPNIPVDISDHLLSADEIAQALVNGDQTADLYATFADHTFRAIVKKGYAADLSSSSILSTDILSMYPTIQHVITDDAGNPVAYPYTLLLDHWQVNETLWLQIFGDRPVPTTYDQFMDAMISWESTYADEYPEINFSEDFDHAYWVRKIINAYAQQYGKPGSPVTINSPELRSVLGKLEQVRNIRNNNGRNIDFMSDGEFMAYPDIFITAGFNNVLLDPVDPSSQMTIESSDDLGEGIYTDMAALVFEEGEQSLIPGQMIVWFVNPYSQHKDLAIQYLECAAQMNNNPRTYYATHPDINKPLEREGYEASVQEMEKRRDELQEALKGAEGAERSSIEENLTDVENELANQEKRKWAISEKAITNYRPFASSISFFEDNPYITPDGSSMLHQLEGLYRRYAHGLASLDDFLKELDEKMRMLYLEGE